MGAETVERLAKLGRDQYDAQINRDGCTAWVDEIAGNKVSITFFAGPSMEYQRLFHDGPPGQNLTLVRLDDQLHPLDEAP